MFGKKFQIVTQIVGTITLAFLAVYGLMGLLENSGAASPQNAQETEAPQTTASRDSNQMTVPQVINYEGHVKDPEGKPLRNQG